LVVTHFLIDMWWQVLSIDKKMLGCSFLIFNQLLLTTLHEYLNAYKNKNTLYGSSKCIF